MTTPHVVARVRALRISFPSETQPAVNGISFELRAGEVTALVGESGSGKSLTARALIGLLPHNALVTHERFEVPGPQGTSAAPTPQSGTWQQLRGAHIALVPQDALGGLDPLRRIEHEVGDTLRIHHRLTKAARAPRILAALEAAGMPDPEKRVRQRSDELSGGLRQRALVAATLVDTPQLIIADEPTTALDTQHRDRVLAALEARARSGAAVLLITHDLESARLHSDQVLVMRQGSIVEQGTSATVFSNPAHAFTRELRDAQLNRHQRAPRPSSSTTAALELREITAGYTSTPVLQRVSLRISPGRTLGLIGASGAGKTTLLRVALGLHRPRAGTVHLRGEQFSPLAGVAGAHRQRQLRHRIGYVPQDPLATFPRGHTGAQILADAQRAAGIPRTQRNAGSVALAADVGLAPALLQRPAALLSGGERQRLAIARALASTPDVLLLDEPVSALDLTVQARILELLIRLQEQRGTAYLLVSHDPQVIRTLSDHTATLANGQLTSDAQ